MSLTEREEAFLTAASALAAPFETADVRAPYVKLGGSNPDYIWQGGHIYAWSDSNIAYQHCWWLTPLGKPVAAGTQLGAEHVANLLRDRPFDAGWLKAAVPPE